MTENHTSTGTTIDPLDSKLIALCDLPSMLPRRHGKKVSIKTVRRWALKGVGGRVLPTVRVGSMLYTSRDALRQFMSTSDCGEIRRVEHSQVRVPKPRNSRNIARERVREIFGIKSTEDQA